MRLQSFELVEEFSRAALDLWPSGGGGGGDDQEKKAHDIDCLLEAGTLKMLMARTYQHDRQRKAETHCRNGKAQTNRKPQWQLETDGKADLDLELVSFSGVAFSGAAQVLWSVAPLADHQSQAAISSTHLKRLITHHKEDMCQVFGSYVLAEDAPVEQVLDHISNI